MSSYQHTWYEHLRYSSNGGAQSWSDAGYGYGKAPVGTGCGYGYGGLDHAADGGYGYGYGSGRFGPQYRAQPNRAPSMTPNTVVEGSDLISALVPSAFPPGTDPRFIECFNKMDRDGNGSICDRELQAALSTFDQRFSLRTVHLLMYLFTGSSANAVGPKEFVPLVRCLQTWKGTFEMFDRNKNGRMDERELREALMSMGYNLSPFVLRLLVSKFAKSAASAEIEYDYFIECCLVIKGLTDKFKTKEDSYTGTATFTYDEFLLTVLPFVVMT